MECAGFMDIPSLARKLLDEQPVYRKNLLFLDRIAYSYNQIINNSNAQERELLHCKVKEIDSKLQTGINKITWSDPGKLFISKG